MLNSCMHIIQIKTIKKNTVRLQCNMPPHYYIPTKQKHSTDPKKNFEIQLTKYNAPNYQLPTTSITKSNHPKTMRVCVEAVQGKMAMHCSDQDCPLLTRELVRGTLCQLGHRLLTDPYAQIDHSVTRCQVSRSTQNDQTLAYLAANSE